MRTREEIVEELYEGDNGEEFYWQGKVLEVLLDIRDLLSQGK